MEENHFSKFRLIVILSIIAMVALVGVIIVMYIISNQGQIANRMSGDISKLEKTDVTHIEDRLKSYLKTFYGMTNDEIAKVDMVIREGSVTIDEYEGIRSADFLVDLSNPKLTYGGTLVVGGSEDELFLSCPPLSLMQDKNVFCIGHERESTIDNELGDDLPYETNIMEDNYFSIWADFGENNLPTLKASAGVCDDDDQGKKAIKSRIYEWISSKTEVSPDVFPLEMIYLDCEAFGDYYDFSEAPDPVRYDDEEDLE